MVLRFLIVIFSIFLIGCNFSSGKDTEIISLPQGDMVGFAKGDTDYFLGIPYAEPPIGANRFAPPKSHKGWNDVLKAKEAEKQCMQPQGEEGELSEFFEVFLTKSGMKWWEQIILENAAWLFASLDFEKQQSEDCLFINIIKPSKIDNGSLPVMVWFHGGGYNFGNGDGLYITDRFAKRDVILVTMNYRLGPFGFFAHPLLSETSKMGVSGNYGTLDQIQALKWVQTNIHLFGGDPDNVTIFGESAGGASVETLVSTKLAKDLFHKAIAQSGYTVGRARNIREQRGDLISAESLGEKFFHSISGIDNPSVEDIKNLSADLFFETEKFEKENDSEQAGWFPIEDKWVFDSPTQISFTEGKTNDVIYVAGFNANEGTNLSPFVFGEKLNENDWIKQTWEMSDFSYLPLPDDVKAYGESLEYSKERSANELWGDLAFGGDGFFMVNQFASNGGEAYLYYFEKGPSSDTQTLDAAHGLELFYLFDNIVPFWPWKKIDDEIRDTMLKDWTDIAKYGKPRSEWQKFDPNNPKAMHYGQRIEFKTPEKLSLYKSLEKVYLEEGKNF